MKKQMLIAKQALGGRGATPVPGTTSCCVAGCKNHSQIVLAAWGDAVLSSCVMHAQTWLASPEQRRAKNLLAPQKLVLLRSWALSVIREGGSGARGARLTLVHAATRP
jgi:hypothetical protein